MLSFFLFLFLTTFEARANSLATEVAGETFLGGAYKAFSPSVNISNRILESPDLLYFGDFRGDLKLKYKENFKFVFRPRVVYQTFSTPLENPTERKFNSIGRFDLIDTYLDYQVTPNLNLAAGLLNYQWGPAEIYSPSNPLFHLFSDQRTFLFRQKGKVLIKAIYNFTPHLNFVAIFEPINNQTPNWISEVPFSQKFLAKLEYSFENSFNYLGLTAGYVDQRAPFVAEYFNYSPLDGFSLYADAIHMQGNKYYQPRLNALGVYDLVLQENFSQVNTLAVGGVRFEDFIDVRLEYVYNSAGLDSSSISQAISSVHYANPNFSLNAKRLANSGLEVPGRQYAYFSLRKPNIFNVTDFNAALRILKSMQDSSVSFQVDFDKPLNDSLTAYIELIQNSGENLSEFSLQDKFQAWAAIKYSF